MAGKDIPQDECQGILDFMQEVCLLLKLQAYTINILDKPCDDDAHATIDFVDGRWVAELSLNDKWPTYSDDLKFQVILHETIHLTHRAVNDVIRDQVHQMTAHGWGELWRRYMDQMELFVDHFTSFLETNYNLREYWDKVHGKITEPEVIHIDRRDATHEHKPEAKDC